MQGRNVRRSAARLASAAAFVVLLATLGTSLGFLNGDRLAGFLFLVTMLPAMTGAAVTGLLVGHLLRARAWLVAVAAFAIAGVPVAYAVGEQLERGERVPAAIERTLPLKSSLGAACPGDGYDRMDGRRAERQGRALLVVLRRRPDDLVRHLYRHAHDPEEFRLITVRELAEEQLRDLEIVEESCDIALATTLRRALGR